MPKLDFVEACREGRFHVWAVGSVNDWLEILAGIEVGTPDHKGIDFLCSLYPV